MIVSLRHRFVFLSMPKCGSTSIMAALRGEASVMLRHSPALKHATLADYETHIEPLLAAKHVDVNSLDIYALFRNPVDWVESWWRYRSRDALARPNHPRHQNYVGNVSLHQFAEHYMSNSPPAHAQIGTQAQVIADRSGTIGRVQLFRYDDIDAFVRHLSDRLGRDIAVKRWNESPPRADQLSSETIAAFRSRRPRDFEIYDSIPAREAVIAS